MSEKRAILAPPRVSFWFQIFSCSFQKHVIIIFFLKGRSSVPECPRQHVGVDGIDATTWHSVAV